MYLFLHRSGYYVFVETSSPRRQGDKARLVGPKFNPSSTKRCIQFWYHMFGRSTGSLSVLAKWGAGNKSEATLWTLKGSQGSQWSFGRISVSRNDAYRVSNFEIILNHNPGQNIDVILYCSSFCFQFVFEGVVGSSYTGDIALDDIQIVNQACSVLPLGANPNPTSSPTIPTVTTPKPIRK
jgi:hypothetical protein